MKSISNLILDSIQLFALFRSLGVDSPPDLVKLRALMKLKTLEGELESTSADLTQLRPMRGEGKKGGRKVKWERRKQDKGGRKEECGKGEGDGKDSKSHFIKNIFLV